MNNNDWLRTATDNLTAAGIGTARLDCLVLLEDATGHDKAWLLAHPEFEIPIVTIKLLNRQLNQRVRHMPLSYVRSKTEFYGREFKVNARVLEPRPESETMIDVLKKLALNPHPSIADVGSGSGALGITAALEIPTSKVHLYDIDPSTLSIARYNGRRYKLKLHYYEGDLLVQNWGPYDVLLCNLPYVPNHYTINEAAAMEPRRAIFGGTDGLDLYRRLFTQLQTFDWQPHYVLCESLPMQHKPLVALADKHGFVFDREDDFIQVFMPA